MFEKESAIKMLKKNADIQETIRYYESIPYQTQAQRNYEMLIEMIAMETIPEDVVLTETDIAELLQSGRTPVREALKRLQFDSVIQTVPRLGVHVRKCRIEDYFLLVEVRTALEKVVIRRACSFASEEDLKRLDKLNSEFKKEAAADNRLAVYRIDRSIHATIDQISKNPYAVHALESLRFFEQRVHYLLSRVYTEIGRALNEEHILFVDGIVKQDEEKACIHFDNMIGRTMDLIQMQITGKFRNPFEDKS